MKATRLITVAAIALLGITACSSNKKLFSVSGPIGNTTPVVSIPSSDFTVPTVVSIPNVSLPPGVSIPTDVTFPNISLPPGVTLPSGVSIPTEISIPANVTLPPGISIPGASSNCLAIITAFGTALSGDSAALSGLPDALAKLEGSVPDNLKADFKTVADAYTKLSAIYTKYGNDYAKAATDPEFLTLFSDPKFATAESNVSTYLSTQCGEG